MILTALCFLIPIFGMAVAATFGFVAFIMIIVVMAQGDRRGLPLLLCHLFVVPMACGVVALISVGMIVGLGATAAGKAQSPRSAQSDRTFLHASQPSSLAVPTPAPSGVTQPTVALAPPGPRPDATPTQPPRGTAREANAVILSLLDAMPRGGGAAANRAVFRDLQAAVQVRGGQLRVDPFAAPTAYMAAATYLVFVQAVMALNDGKPLTGALADLLAIKSQPDGVGIWGRWNANGPATACLFRELGLGRNFTSFDAARPGDFIKMFFTEAVGPQERSVSAIYLGREVDHGVEAVRYWTSSRPTGYGEKSVPRSRIAHVVFSRLEAPKNIENALLMPARNAYLASLTARASSLSEALTESDAD